MNNKSQDNVQGDYLHYSSAGEILSPIDAAALTMRPVDGRPVSTIVYVDDVLLLSGRMSKLVRMLDLSRLESTELGALRAGV